MGGGGVDHFHVHIVALENEGYVGLSIGKAHLLSDLISLVRTPAHTLHRETDPDRQLSLSKDDEPSLLQQMTLAYSLGREDGLYRAYQEAGVIA